MGRGSVAAAAITLAVLAPAAPARAQEPRYTVRATLTGAAVYDDNIYFETDDEDGGAVMRFRPTGSGSYRLSRNLSLDASYSFDADYYPSQPDLSDAFASHGGALGGRYRAGERTTLSASVQRAESANAGELFGGWGLELGRLQGSVWGFTGGVSRRISKGGAVGADYSYQTVRYGGTVSDTSRAQSVSLTYNQQLTARTEMSLGFGPRFVDGGRSTDASAALQYRLERGSLGLAYGRSRYPAPGRDVDTETVTLTAQLRLSPTVALSASPGFFTHRYGEDATGDGRAWRLALSGSWQARRDLAMRVTYQHIRQTTATTVRETSTSLPWIARNLLAVSFSVGVGAPRPTAADPGIGPTNAGSTR